MIIRGNDVAEMNVAPRLP